MEIRSISGLNRYLKGLQKPAGQIKIIRNHTAYVKNQKFTGLKLNGFSWHGKYSKCKFFNCEFDGIFGFFLSLQDCEFHKCHFRNCRFSHFEYIGDDASWDSVQFKDCYFAGLRFDEGEMYNIFFDNCSIEYINLGLEATENIWFTECKIGDSFFIGFENTKDENSDGEDDFPDVMFEESVLDNCVFIKSDFGNSYFQNASLYMCAFIDCVLTAQTFFMDKPAKYPNYATMDFQTILKSDNIDFDILQEYFHIHTPDI
ncbi:MAG: pentapeptide repeat-containing protein, partial [Pseudanabaena sp. M57BS1SP1A06MG]|nr:pentapeptide repeat-containing protein [Pseudanabaena sp. M57BS1SP1A06MG]